MTLVAEQIIADVKDELPITKVCFLDFDGVITATHRAFLAKLEYDPISCMILNRGLTEFGYAIVVSSTWRLGEPFLTLCTYLRLMGLKVRVHPDFKTTEIYDKLRGNQIKEWLSRHPEVTDYLIIDDDQDMLESQLDRFIHCDGSEGFGAKEYKRMKYICSEKEDI